VGAAAAARPGTATGGSGGSEASSAPTWGEAVRAVL